MTPLTYTPGRAPDPKLAHFYPGDPIRQIERASIRAFMERHAALLKGRTVDFGCGEMPYRDLVTGPYEPYEKSQRLPGGYFDAVMCNQVLQYVHTPASTLGTIHSLLQPGGTLLLTYRTNWDQVEDSDRWRFTKSGMFELLQRAGFIVSAHELLSQVAIGNFTFPLSHGAVCTRA